MNYFLLIREEELDLCTTRHYYTYLRAVPSVKYVLGAIPACDYNSSSSSRKKNHISLLFLDVKKARSDEEKRAICVSVLKILTHLYTSVDGREMSALAVNS